MDVDLFMEFAAPAHAGVPPFRLFEDGLALARTADSAGFGAAWLAEHHFLDDYSTSAAPDMLLSAMARETRRIKLGFGIIPLPLHDIVRVAERIATLDELSQGRVLWGVGRGVTTTELEGFGIDPATSREVFRERFDGLKAILETGSFARAGKTYRLRPKPRSRLGTGWMAAVSPESFTLAAELGLHVMAGPFKPWPLVKADLKRYRRLRPDGKTSFTVAVYCQEDQEGARRRAEPGLVWAYHRMLEITRPLMSQQIAGYEHYRNLGWITPLFHRILSLPVLESMGLAVVGNPDHVRENLLALQRSGLDRISLVIGGGDLTVAETTGCVELLANEVLPDLATIPAGLGKAVPA
jgi:alkanesulfonate monooxygenase SsuD/methylene tetrahydromethanopterin reductase-like flavin-dependent oxidoreductase (luciferase family)